MNVWAFRSNTSQDEDFDFGSPHIHFKFYKILTLDESILLRLPLKEDQNHLLLCLRACEQLFSKEETYEIHKLTWLDFEKLPILSFSLALQNFHWIIPPKKIRH